MRGVKIETPRGMGCGEGVSPPHWGRGLGRGLGPLPRKNAVFASKPHVCDALLTPF